MQEATHFAKPVRVHAVRILDVTDVTDRSGGKDQSSPDLLLRLEDGRNVSADSGMTARYVPVPGDYLVVQEDGYAYLNPKDVFERKYHPISTDEDWLSQHRERNLTFPSALELLKEGQRVARAGWNGKGMWLELQMPDEHSKMTLPYVFLSYPNDAQNTPGARVPWLASQTDMLAEDWMLLA